MRFPYQRNRQSTAAGFWLAMAVITVLLFGSISIWRTEDPTTVILVWDAQGCAYHANTATPFMRARYHRDVVRFHAADRVSCATP
jgi:hypothetical protein